MNVTLSQLPYLNYPDPRMRRKNYTLLDGEWDFSFQEENSTEKNYDRKILVPFTYETIKSGIHETKMHEHVCYKRQFQSEKGRYLLHFLGVDYQVEIIIDGNKIGSHQGAYSSFSFPVELEEGKHEIVLLIHDSFAKEQMRGKQRTKNENYECWYTQYTGVFKSIYLEKINDNYIKELKISGDENGTITYDIELEKEEQINFSISLRGKEVVHKILQGNQQYHGTIVINNPELYSHENPVLYDVKAEIEGKDTLESYFGFRSILAEGGKLLLNHTPLYLEMILNQGYYYEKGITPEKEDLIKDFSLIIASGFNGIRIHQKQEVPLFYYLADVLGVYLWSEMPSCYEYGEQMKKEFERELPRIVRQNFNSPSILCYVLFNESWGIPSVNQSEECQEYVRATGKRIKRIDPTRLCILNDGWFQLTETEVLSLHEYEQDSNVFLKEYRNKDMVTTDKIINHYGTAFAKGNHYRNQPIILSEFGGASFSHSGWGYGEKKEGPEAYRKQLSSIFSTIRKLPYLSGYCYTQFTDVEQETNGLFYPDRSEKIPIEEIRKIVSGGEDYD